MSILRYRTSKEPQSILCCGSNRSCPSFQASIFWTESLLCCCLFLWSRFSVKTFVESFLWFLHFRWPLRSSGVVCSLSTEFFSSSLTLGSSLGLAKRGFFAFAFFWEWSHKSVARSCFSILMKKIWPSRFVPFTRLRIWG